jgi:hypothetical protein
VVGGDHPFYELAVEGASISIDVENQKMMYGDEIFLFAFDFVEEQLLVVKIYEQFGPSHS